MSKGRKASEGGGGEREEAAKERDVSKGRKAVRCQETRKYRGGQRKKAGQRGVLDVDWLTGKEVGEGRTATKAARYPEDASRQKKAKY